MLGPFLDPFLDPCPPRLRDRRDCPPPLLPPTSLPLPRPLHPPPLRRHHRGLPHQLCPRCRQCAGPYWTAFPR